MASCEQASTTDRTILHVDLDAFFASVEVRDDPSLAGRPVVVGGDPKGGHGRGVVAAASYEARRYGIHSAMPISRAYRRCPDAAFLRPRGAEYAATSARFMEVLGRYSDLIEAVSIDEAFVDVSASTRLCGDGEQIAHAIKRAVSEEERLVASIGVAPVKFVAKIASDLEKPDGLVVVPAESVEAFLAGVSIERLWGAGPRAIEKFRSLGVGTIGGIARISQEELGNLFGERSARHFARLARGDDDRPVCPDRQRKSVGRETTFLEDVSDRSLVEATLLNLVEEVARRLRRKGLRGRTVCVKLRTHDFHTVTRQASLAGPSDTTEAIWPRTHELFVRADASRKRIRLVGVSISGFAEDPQLSLFRDPGDAREHKLAAALDAVSDRFGDSAIQRGRTPRRARVDSAGSSKGK